MNFTKVFKLPAPLSIARDVEQWGPGAVMIDPVTERATVQLIECDAQGAVLPNATRRTLTVQPTQYRLLFATEQGQAIASALTQMILAAGTAAQAVELPVGTTIIDVEQE